MTITKQVIRQRDWSGGQLDATFDRRDDVKLYKLAAKYLRDVRPLPTGGLTRRPGRRIIYFDGGRHDIVRPVADVTFDVTFAEHRFTARLRSGAIVSDLSAPWSADQLPLSWVLFGRRIFVTSRTMQPQIVEYDRDAGTWSITPYTFRANLDGTQAAPFYRFADFGETMQPSALTGSITLTTSADVFVPEHTGTLFTYGGRQVRIDSVTDARHAIATVLEALPPVWRVTMASVEGYKVGEVVIGDTSNTVGEIMAIGAGTLDIFTTKNFGGFTNTEFVVGEEGRSTVTSSTKAGTTLAATVQWKEQFMSDVRGWPGFVGQGFSRLIFTDFDQAENFILWSGLGGADNLKITGKADGAILEPVPTTCRVLAVGGTADLFVLTDKSVYYIPVGAQTPLAPGSVEFRPLGTAGASRVRPISVGEGLVFVGATLPTIWAIVPTGQQAQPYAVKNLNRLSQSLFNAPVSLAASEGQTETNPEAHLFVVNADGSLVIGHGSPQDDYIGWFPWGGASFVTDVAAVQGDVIFTSRCMMGDGSTIDVVESIDDRVMFDCAIELADFVGTDPIRDSTGDPLRDSTGAIIFAAGGALVPFANETMQGWATDGFYLGDVAVGADGLVSIDGTDLTSVVIGFNFTPTVRPFIEDVEGGDDLRQRLRRRKISGAAATVRASHAFSADGHVFNSYRVGEDTSLPPPSRDGTFRWRQTGRSFDPEVEITQPTPGPFTLVEFTAEVSI